MNDRDNLFRLSAQTQPKKVQSHKVKNNRLKKVDAHEMNNVSGQGEVAYTGNAADTNVKELNIYEIDENSEKNSEVSLTPHKDADAAGFLALGSLGKKLTNIIHDGYHHYKMQ